MSETIVSIVCLVYNHEKYLKETIEGFISQKTDFSFEVLIHDDCSIDDSAKIIIEYANKYPSIIKPILQKENQLSQGKGILRNYILPIAKGKYIAFCEGDDCWIDEYKLSKQVNYMENHPECTFCFTNGIIKNVQTGDTKTFIPYKKSDIRYIKPDGIYSLTELAKLSFIPTCSFLFPRKNYDLYPDYYWERCYGGDRKDMLFATALGYAYCLNENTCCYHYAVQESAMTKSKSKKQIAEIERSYINLHERINRFTNYKYNDFFSNENVPYLKWIYCLQGQEKLLSDKEMEIVTNALTITDKVKRLLLMIISDRVFNYIRNVKRRIR